MRFLEGLLPVAALLGLVAALAQTTPAAGKSVMHTFKGVLLTDLILAARSMDAEVGNTSLGFGWYVLAQEADDYEVSLGESAPGLGNRSVLLAYEQHGPLLLAADEAARRVEPGDLNYLGSLVRLTTLPEFPAASSTD